MLQIPMDVFAYTKEAVAAARGGKVFLPMPRLRRSWERTVREGR